MNINMRFWRTRNPIFEWIRSQTTTPLYIEVGVWVCRPIRTQVQVVAPAWIRMFGETNS